jgi:hypothetical protein
LLNLPTSQHLIKIASDCPSTQKWQWLWVIATAFFLSLCFRINLSKLYCAFLSDFSKKVMQDCDVVYIDCTMALGLDSRSSGYESGMNVKKMWQREQPRNATRALKREKIAQLCVNMASGSVALGLSLATGLPQVMAATPPAQSPPASAAPPVIATLLKQLDTVASRKDLDATMRFYSPSFSHGDGLDFKTQQQVLKGFWQDTKSIQYQTQINNWKAEPQGYTVETTTTLKGVRKAAERDMDLTATVRSRLTIKDQKIVTQEILSEQTRLVTGNKPPSVRLSLPEQVNIGQAFSFDAVVTEPLGDDLLLGSAIEESITPAQYLQPSAVTLEPLSAGGIFKTGQAPQQPTRKWISAVLIKNGGITIVSQRMNVVRPNGSTTPAR